MNHFELIFIQWEIGVQFYSFACRYPVVLEQFVEKTILSPFSWPPWEKLIRYNCQVLFLDSQSCSIDLWVYFYILCQIIMSWLLLFYSEFSNQKCPLLNFVLFQDYFGYSSFLTSPYEFYDKVINFWGERAARTLTGIVLSL